MSMRNAILVAALCLPLAGCFEYSNGDRVGTITKFSKKGFFCKTWEGEMFLGGMRKKSNYNEKGEFTGTSVVANVWPFTVEDETLVPLVKAALESGEPVVLHYKEEMISFCRSDSGSYFVTSVRGADGKPLAASSPRPPMSR